jgi:hypothetical protein
MQHVCNRRGILTASWLKNLKGRNYLQELAVDGNVILKLIESKHYIPVAVAGPTALAAC